MKKHLRKISLLLTVVFFYSCSTNNESATTPKNLAKIETRFAPEKFDFIGVQHNLFLDKIKTELIDKDVADSLLQSEAEISIYNNVSEVYIDKTDLEIAKERIHAGLRTIPMPTKHSMLHHL